MTTEQRNNAICAYMGGPDYLKQTHFSYIAEDKQFDMIGPSDLRFHESWDWLIPVWSKVRFEMKSAPAMIIAAITYIDENRILDLHTLISNVCIQWCKNKNINL